MANTRTTSLHIFEMREFASFTAEEQAFITRSLDIFMGRGDAFKAWGGSSDDCASIRAQYIAYRKLRSLVHAIPDQQAHDGVGMFIGALIRISAQDMALGKIESFSAYRFLYECMLGAAARPFLPSAFVGAAALPAQDPAPVTERGRCHRSGLVNACACLLPRTHR